LLDHLPHHQGRRLSLGVKDEKDRQHPVLDIRQVSRLGGDIVVAELVGTDLWRREGRT
jgi:hypothetical protein